MALLAALILSLVLPSSLADPSTLHPLLTSPAFSGFTRLLEHGDVIPEIESALQQGQILTVFAPTDEALMSNTSPTLLAFLKQTENRDILRKVLLSHFVTQSLSPFHWEGSPRTLAGSTLPLSFDTEAFYVDGVVVTRYNALVCGSGAATVHSIPTLILPASLGNTRSLLKEGVDVRRFLQATAPASGPALAPEPEPRAPSGSTPNAAQSQALASILMLLGAAILAAALI